MSLIFGVACAFLCLCAPSQVNRRQAHAEAVAAEYAALQQEHTNLENDLLEAKSQVHLLQAEVRMEAGCRVHVEARHHPYSTAWAVPAVAAIVSKAIQPGP